MEDEEIKRVVDICQRLEPILHRFIEGLVTRDGANVTISVISNLGTTFMAQAITMIEARGGDVDQFVKILMVEVKNKYDVGSSQIKAEGVLSKMMSGGPDTCRPMH